MAVPKVAKPPKVMISGIFEEDEDDTYFTKRAEPRDEFDFKNMSLEDVIKLKKDLADRPKKHTGGPDQTYGSEFGDERKPTPMSALRALSEQGFVVNVATKEIAVMRGEKDSRKHRWRAEWSCEGSWLVKVTGIGEGGGKLLAKQAGALDLVNKLRKGLNEGVPVLPECRIPLGCRISPFIFCMLDDLVKDYATPEFQIQKTNRGDFGRKQYICICFVGDETFIGESGTQAYAQRFAAKSAFDTLSGTPYRLEPIITGDKCFQPKKFNPVESETSRIYDMMDDNYDDTDSLISNEELAANHRKRKNFGGLSESTETSDLESDGDVEIEIIAMTKKLRGSGPTPAPNIVRVVQQSPSPPIVECPQPFDSYDMRVYEELGDSETEQ